MKSNFIQAFIKKGIVRLVIDNSLLSLYLLMFLGILFGSIYDAGTTFLPHLLLVSLALLTSYISLFFLQKKYQISIEFKLFDKFISRGLDYALLLLCITIVLVHFFSMGHIPVITALLSSDYVEIVHIRNDIPNQSPTFIWYLCHISLKALFPGLAFYFFYNKQRFLGWSILLLGMAYGFAMMQKSYALSITLPSLIYFLFRLKFFPSLLVGGLILSQIYGLVYITNPDLRSQLNFENENLELVDEDDFYIDMDENYIENLRKSINTSSNTLVHRVFLLPGAMVNNWFRIIPEKMPFLEGAGYRFLSPFLEGKKYVDYNRQLYRVIYPSYAKRGFKGNVNAASFIYEYSNFGKLGLFLSGLLLGVILFFTQLIFKDYPLVNFAFNGMYIFYLSSIAMSTLLFSGGWIFTILLFLVLKKRFQHG